jgi:polar amino acid transport system substrate-binding protein
MTRKFGRSRRLSYRCENSIRMRPVTGQWPWHQAGRVSGLRSRAALIITAVLIAGVAETAQARTLQQVLDRRIFAICAHPDAPPYSAREPQPNGLQIDLAAAVAQRLGVELREEWILLRRDARQVGCDAIMAGVAPEAPSNDRGGATPAATRAASSGAPPGQAMSRPYAAQLTRVVFRSDARPIVSVDDLKGRSVAVPPASFVHYLLDTRGIAVRTPYRAETDILSAVDSGAMEAGVVSEWSLGWYRKTHPQSHLEASDQQIIDPALDFNVAIVLRNADQALLSRVNEIVGGLMDDGTMGRIFGNYGISYRLPLVR